MLLSFRHGFSRKVGWISLVILAIIRIIGGVAHILSEGNPSNVTERTIYGIMESAGTSPLLLATLGFLRTVTQFGLDESQLVSKGLRIAGLACVIGLVLAVIGGSNIGNASTQQGLNIGNTLRHVGAILFAVVYGATVVLTAYCWTNMSAILKYRKRLLTGITITLPFILVRVLYGVLSAFAPLPYKIENGHLVPLPGSTSGLTKFGITSPQWLIWLIMSVLAEYIAVSIYAVVGMLTPLSKDAPDYESAIPRQGSAASSGQGFVPPQLHSRYNNNASGYEYTSYPPPQQSKYGGSGYR
ncbi:hypothetical protein BD414DRAFT_490821 [Trametes punicea]|nr:hypothetical protein BD414DRAFT_490821 [Trametes punicea]